MGMNDEVSNLQPMDGSVGNEGPLEEEAMCKRASVQYRRNPNATWPFLFSIKQGETLVNRSVRTSKYQDATLVGEALL